LHIIALLDTDPDSEYGSKSGSTNPIESGFYWDPDPESQPWKIVPLLEGKFYQAESLKKGKFGTLFIFFYLSDWKTENVEDASIGEIEGFN
jgi:hypothetical protein